MLAILVIAVAKLISAQATDQQDLKVSAKEGDVATQAMLDYALNLRTASEYTVYAERGVSQKGSSIKGEIGDARRDAAGRKATKELSNSIDAIRQLPCNEVKSSDLGRSFTPGVYCLDSAELAGEMVLTGGDAASTYIFRVAGSLNAKSGSSIRLENGAQAGNVYFVADEATVASDSTFRANILTTKKADIAGTVTGKVLSLGEVSMDMAHVAGGGTGTMEICKEQQLPVTADNDLSNQIYHFTVTGAVNQGTAANPVKVAVGQCSAPFDVTAGNQTVTELNDGTLISPFGTPWTGNFELVNVSNLTPASTSSLGLVNLATRTANVNIVEGNVAESLILTFTNRRTISGFIEVCKRAATGPGTLNPPNGPLGGGDSGVVGYFSFTVEGTLTANTLNPTQRELQVFTIPVGQCTGPIAVSLGDPAPDGSPAASSLRVTEIGRAGTVLEGIEVQPANRLITNAEVANSFALGSQVNPDGSVTADNPGGGFQRLKVLEGTTSANETIVTFVNRGDPAPVKVCNIAGPGVALGTLMQFNVTGTSAATGLQVTRTLSVPAGDIVQGGVCQFVTDGSSNIEEFISGTPVLIEEVIPSGIAVSGITSGSSNNSSSAFTISTSANPARVQLPSTAFVSVFPNPKIPSGKAIVTAVGSITHAAFTNTIYTPANLKICKIAGNGIPLGEPFTFNLQITSEAGMTVPPLIVAAGDASQGGNCVFALGPYAGGTFNVGQVVWVVELPSSGITTEVTSITSSTGTVQSVDLPGRSVTKPLDVPNVNLLSFTNIVDDTTPPLITPTVSGTLGNNGFYTSDVTVNWSVSDPNSNVFSTNGCGQTVISSDTTGTVLTCTAESFGGSANQSVTIKRDATAPVLAGLNGNSVDSGTPAAVNYSISVSDNLDPSPAAVCSPAAGSTFAVGITNVTCNAADAAGNAAQQSVFQVYVLAPGNEATPVGDDVTVQSTTGTELTFDNVSSPGVTAIQPISDPEQAGTIPGGFSVSGSIAFEISTTATFSGPITSCLSVPTVDDPVEFANLRILHSEFNSATGQYELIDRTSSHDFPNRKICATTTSLSPFYLAKVSNKVQALYDESINFIRQGNLPITLKMLNANNVNISSQGLVLRVRNVRNLDTNTTYAADAPGHSNPRNLFDFRSNRYVYRLDTSQLPEGRYVLTFYAGDDTEFFYSVGFGLRNR